MKASKSTSARERQPAQKYCEYFDSDGKVCGRPLLGFGRASQGRSKFCVRHSKIAEKESRKQNVGMWVKNCRQKRPDLEVFRNYRRSFTDKVIHDIEVSSFYYQEDRELLEFCSCKRSNILKWEREERLFGHKMISIGYPMVYSSTLIPFKQVLVQPVNGKSSATCLYVLTMASSIRRKPIFFSSLFRRHFGLPDLPTRSCNPSHANHNIRDKLDNLPSFALTFNDQHEISCKNVVISFASSSFVSHTIMIAKLSPNYWLSAEDVYNRLVDTCPAIFQYPLCLIHSIRDLSNKKREIIVSTTTPYNGVGQGSGEVGTRTDIHIPTYRRPPFLEPHVNSLRVTDSFTGGFVTTSVSVRPIILYRGKETVNVKMGEGC